MRNSTDRSPAARASVLTRLIPDGRVCRNGPDFNSKHLRPCGPARWVLGLLATGVLAGGHTMEVSKVIAFTESTRFSPPAIGVDGKVYVGIQHYGIGMYDPRTGAKKQQSLGGSVVSGPTIGLNGWVYVGINAGGRENFFALDSQTLTQQWAIALQGNIDTSAAVGRDGAIYVGTKGGWGGRLYRLNPHTGDIVWWLATGDITCSPVIGQQHTLYVAHNKSLLAVHAVNGKLLWQFPTGKGDITTTPAIGSDGTVYCGDDQGIVWAIKPDGTRRWAPDLGGSVISGITVGEDGTVFVGVAGPSLYALKPDGTVRWSKDTEGPVRNAPVVSNDGKIHLVEGKYAVTRRAADGVVLGKADRRDARADYGLPVKVNDWAQVADGLLTHEGIFWFSNGTYLWSYKVGGRASIIASYPMGQGDLSRSGRMKPAQPCFFAPLITQRGAVHGALLGMPGATYSILETEDFRTWVPLDRVTTHNGIVPLRLEYLPTPSHRFYRAVELP